jgi:DNA repair exonuclease SbcCD ATPase subunit
MNNLQLILVMGALFKKKVTPPPVDDKAREAIRKKVDDLREREDALREKEGALSAREEKVAAREAEMARRVQDIAAKENELKAKLKAVPDKAPEHKDKPTEAVPKKETLPGDATTLEGQGQVVKTLEERLEKARAHYNGLQAREERRKEFAAKLEEYRGLGISVARLEAVMTMDLEEIKTAFEVFETDLAALSGLVDRIDAVDRVFAQQADALKARCTDPDAIEEIEDGLKELENAAGNKRKEMLTKVEGWRNQGFSVARFEKPPATLGEFEEAITHYEEDLEVLRMFGEKLDRLDKAFASDIDEIRKGLKDPDGISEMEQEILALEQKIGTQRQEFAKILEGWKAERYNTSEIEKAMGSDLLTIQGAFLKYEEDLRKLKTLSEKAATLDRAFSQQIETISANLRDPLVIQKIELAIQGVEEETERRKAAFRTKIDGYKAQGYDVSRLNDAMGGDLGTIDKAFGLFEGELLKLNALVPRIEALEKENRYPDDLKKVRAMLLEHGGHIRLERRLLELEERSMADREREAADKRKAARDAADRERKEQLDKERSIKDRVEREKLERERLERERLQKETEERERHERESLEKERLQKEKEDKARLEREEAERKRKEEEERKAAPVSAPAQPTLPAPAAGGSPEENVKAQLVSVEATLKEYETKGVNVTSASNFLKLARSFSRAKNYDKALMYAKKAQDEIANFKK